MVEVGSPQFIIGYVLTFINYVCYCGSRFAKKKRTMLILDLTAKIITVASTFFLGSFSGSLSMILMIVVLFASVYKENHPETVKGLVSVGIYLLLALSFSLVFIFSYQGISTILVVFTCILALTYIWWMGPQGIRFWGAVNSVIFLMYQLSIRNWMGLLEIFVFISNVVSFTKYRKKPETDGYVESGE